MRSPVLAPVLAVVPLALLGSCVGPKAPPPPPPAAAPVVRPAPPPLAAAGSDWRDWPLTPGDWSYAADMRGSTARYGRGGAPAELALRCDRAGRQVVLTTRAAPSATIRTTSTTRALTLQTDGAGRGAATLAAADPLLDAMGFSRGRFVVQPAGGAALVIPAWAEILRVTEDCRG